MVGAVNVPVKGGGEGQLPNTRETGRIIESSYQVSEPIKAGFAHEITPKASDLPTHSHEKPIKARDSYSVGLPPKEKAGLTVCGIATVVGTLFEEVLRRKVFKKQMKTTEYSLNRNMPK